MRQQYAAFQAAGAEIVVIGMGTPMQTRQFIAAEELPFPVLSDPHRQSHRAYSVLRGTLRQLVLNPQVWARGLAASKQGYLPGENVGDGAQLAATFIIDRQGTIRFADYAHLSSDFTPTETLLEALAGL